MTQPPTACPVVSARVDRFLHALDVCGAAGAEGRGEVARHVDLDPVRELPAGSRVPARRPLERGADVDVLLTEPAAEERRAVLERGEHGEGQRRRRCAGAHEQRHRGEQGKPRNPCDQRHRKPAPPLPDFWMSGAWAREMSGGPRLRLPADKGARSLAPANTALASSTASAGEGSASFLTVTQPRSEKTRGATRAFFLLPGIGRE